MRTATLIASALLLTAALAPVAAAVETTNASLTPDLDTADTGPCVAINPDPRNPVTVYECPQS